MKIPFDKCEIKFYCDDIPFKGIGYAVVAKYPAKYRKAILEYILHTILGKKPDIVMVGFKYKQYRKLRFEEFSIKHIHNMIMMQKKLPDISFDYDASLKFKKISDSSIQQYIELYKNIFWDVPNASFYSEDEIYNQNTARKRTQASPGCMSTTNASPPTTISKGRARHNFCAMRF